MFNSSLRTSHARGLVLGLQVCAGLIISISALFAAHAETGRFDELGHYSELMGNNRQAHVVVYGDMRFTDASEHDASVVGARRALVAAIADDNPAAVFLTGDVPWHGGQVGDYEVFHQETQRWQALNMAVWPVLGNHEFSQCEEKTCLENWWQSFPMLKGRRYYSVDVGPSLTVLGLDSNDSLLDGSPQRQWLEESLKHVRSTGRFVMLLLHHPPVADLASGALANHNPRANEQALARYLALASQRYPTLRFVVVAGHIHNYEHLERDGVVYLVSGGGGAKPYAVERTADDLYTGTDEINFHYLKVQVLTARLKIEMVRLTDPFSAEPHQFTVNDKIEIPAASQNP